MSKPIKIKWDQAQGWYMEPSQFGPVKINQVVTWINLAATPATVSNFSPSGYFEPSSLTIDPGKPGTAQVVKSPNQKINVKYACGSGTAQVNNRSARGASASDPGSGIIIVDPPGPPPDTQEPGTPQRKSARLEEPIGVGGSRR